jgi:uncharacterized cofD-like protein
MQQKINIVTFGGGNGSALTLRALKFHADQFDISAVVSMSDSGGSSGKLRKEFNTLPAGDILRAILASSTYKYKELMKPVFYSARPKDAGKLDGHSIGNLFLILAQQYSGDFMNGVRALEQAVDAQATIYPATLEPNDIIATLEDGRTLRGEHHIDRPRKEDRSRVISLAIEPSVQAYPEACTAIERASYLIFGPGSLYCSVIASLLPDGIRESIARSQARLIYVAGDIYEQDGEFGPTTLSKFVSELEGYLPRKINTIVFNNATLTQDQKTYYETRRWGRVVCDTSALGAYQLVTEPFELDSGGLDPAAFGRILSQLCT